MVHRRLFCMLLAVVVGCSPGAEGGSEHGLRTDPARADGPLPLEDPRFKEYWFSGEAEINRYRLEQARYGEVREGDAVLIFVTEDFLPELQVKSESGSRAESGAWLVMKLNQIRKFVTGIYPYSLMTSTFTPLAIDRHPYSLKSSTSAQDWCGHTYLQLNYRGDAYRATLHSYFESEADRSFETGLAWLEDEMMIRVRLGPEHLPTGEVQMIPGGIFNRLRHHPARAEPATVSLDEEEAGQRTYRIEYPDLSRVVTIRFESEFPYGVLGWEETHPSGFGEPRVMTSRAVRTAVVRSAYWWRNANADRELRRGLDLEP